MFKKSYLLLGISCAALFAGNLSAQTTHAPVNILQPAQLNEVKIQDSFWLPRYRVWTGVTVHDVLDKLAGQYVPDRPDIIEEKAKTGRTRDVMVNFDMVAKGEKNNGKHDGPPWYDGLLYETIRGAADLLVQYPDASVEKQIDGYVDHIAAAQAADPDGYIDTYTTLTRPGKRWGTNGGDDKWQHDIYNAGMLAEAATHYYLATGKTKLLEVAVKMSNLMCREMGPAPKKNVIPGHGGPEEAMVNLYRLFKQQPTLKNKLGVPVNEQAYLDLAKFWIQNRGVYGTPGTAWSRNSDSSYNQDHVPVFQQQTIEGHAVRATLTATGVTAIAIEQKDPQYIAAANRYWDNMIGKKMFITGGEGAIADGERFGANYFLPESAYLETCASIGAGFFSEQMSELQADGKYVDEFERVLYNNFLSGVSLSGDHYHYENPLVTNNHPRWAWHSCPCCPPMILKMAGVLPRYIYATGKDGLYVNLFIGSEANLQVQGKAVQVKQVTGYPWKGNVAVTINPKEEGNFTVHVRIPGWAEGKENPFGLYTSNINSMVTLNVNGMPVKVQPVNGYAVITRKWKKGDVVNLTLPVEPRIVSPIDSIQAVKGKLAIAAGPLVYGLESLDNEDVTQYKLPQGSALSVSWQPGLLGGVNTINGNAVSNGQKVPFTAVPFYSLGNREAVTTYQVWLPKE